MSRLRSLVALLLIFAIATIVNSQEVTKNHKLTGKSSFYWQGKQTASGRFFDPSQMTAAHRTLPFGTVVEVTNASNNKKVIVTITDRGPYYGNRVLDLSKGSFGKIADHKSGVVEVKIKILKMGNWKYKVEPFRGR